MTERKKALLQKKTLKIFLKRYKFKKARMFSNTFIILQAQRHCVCEPFLLKTYFSLNT